MALDPRLSLFAGQGVTPLQSPLSLMGQAYQVQGLQQESQARQLQLAEAQRAEQERGTLATAFRGAVTTDPVTGQTRLDVPAAFRAAYRTSSDPLTIFKAEQAYGKSQAESASTGLEAQKHQLEQGLKALEFGGQVAQGIEDRIAAGADPQAAWEWGIATMGRAGMPTESITPVYDATMLAGWKGQALALKDKLTAQQKVVDQQLREQELQETQKRTGLMGEEVDVKRADLAERRAERQQTRETQATQRRSEREEGLRKEFTSLTKDYRTVADAYGRIQSAQETGPGDISLIFSYMKLLDPASTVREGEFATAQNAGGVPERVIAQYNRLVSGERLAPETRKQFLAQAEGLYTQATRDYERTRTHYQTLAERYGADPANVVQEFGSTATPRTGQAGQRGQSKAGPHAGIPLERMTPQQREERKAWLRQQLDKQ